MKLRSSKSFEQWDSLTAKFARASKASDHPESSQSFGREQNSPSGSPMAGTALL